MARRGGFRKSTKPKRKRTAPHNIADEFELDKHQKELERLLKKLNEDGTPKKPLTESAIMSLVRGAIREKWSFCDTKLAYLNMKTVPDNDPNTRRRWKIQCEHPECLKWFGKNDVACDHIVGGHSLKTPEDLFTFYDNILNVSFNDLQILCHECHDRKTACDLHGYTWEESLIFKKVTAWEKQYKVASKAKEWLLSKGFSEDEVSNPEKRRQAIWKYFEQENNND
uniref:HNH endonuclease n=1 Tax=Vibrio phage P018-4 TaxID=3229728 RepID=A0AB39AJE6_9CAUD